MAPAQPITSDDWPLDSPAALEIASDAEARRFLETSANDRCSFMDLERDVGTPGRPEDWGVIFQQCSVVGALPQTSIDPITGDKTSLASKP